MLKPPLHALPWSLLAALALAACGGGGDQTQTGQVLVDGSSTVYPITEAMAEEYMLAEGRGVRVSVGVSGTGGGFERFCAGEIDVANASRPIKESEREACAAAGVEFLELPVAYDGISITVHPDNTLVDCLTVAELRALWRPESPVRLWSQLRPGFPATPIRLYGPGTDSGTFDYFTEAIVGEEDASRADYTASEDDNVLVQGVSGDPGALGYFGFAYYEKNAGRLKLLGVDSGQGCVKPTRKTIASGSYAPLSREMFIYVRRDALQQPHVAGFVQFYLENAAELVPQVGYVPLDAADYAQGLRKAGLAGEERS